MTPPHTPGEVTLIPKPALALGAIITTVATSSATPILGT
jgi:hypothetical protein